MAITDTLLAASDFSTIREIGSNINDARILPYVREAQRIDMLNFLGEDLYYSFLIDQTAKIWDTTKYGSLWNGATYSNGTNTVYNYGMKLMLLYFSYSRFLKNQDIVVTSYGVRVIQDGDFSEKESRAQIMTKSREAYSTGLIYQNQCKAFIKANASDFPLYSPEAKQKETSFKMIKVV